MVALVCLGVSYKLVKPSGARVAELSGDLAQELSKEGIIECLSIRVPGYPKAYNPSLISHEDGYLLSFRVRSKYSPKVKKWMPRTNASFIGVARLDKELNVLDGSVQQLDIVSYSNDVSSTAEDARLLRVGDKIFIFFNDLPPSKKGYALYFAELVKKDGRFSFKEPAKRLKYVREREVEKNWSPFTVGEKLFVIYSDLPRVILEVDCSTGICSEVVRSESNMEWNWGEIRGGTPADCLGDKLLTFFHSSIPVRAVKEGAPDRSGLNYVMGAYIFDREPPYSIRAMTSSPLGQLENYTENNRRKVVFPGGMVIEDARILVTWGKNDKELFITTFDKHKLLGSMKPIDSAASVGSSPSF